MAKLVDVYRMENQPILNRRQLPLIIDEGLTFLQMVMDLNGMGLVGENPAVKGKDLEEFLRKFNILTPPETRMAFEVTCKDLLAILSQAVPCVGCRRSVERLFYQLKNSGHPALDPLIVTSEGLLSIRSDQLASPHILCALLHGHSARLSNLVENQPRSKKSRRCNLHSLDSQRSRPISGAWREVWDCMRPPCKDEVVLIDSASLLTTLESYLRKHRFCGECRTKVLRAYTLLVEEPDPCKEKGYVPALYAGIKRCLPEKHIHLQTKTDYISHLISRAETELLGSRRERHAKTLEIAQEEVLTCLGLCVYERLHRISLRLREEESTCQVLAAVGIEALCRNFEVLVERKQGVSQLELLYQQITKEELAKQQRKEQKKQKRKKKKERRVELEMEEKENNCECESEENVDQNEEELYNPCTCPEANLERHKLQVLDRKSKGSPTCYCKDCQRRKREGGSGTGAEVGHANQSNKVQPGEKKPNRKQTAANNTPSANIHHHRHSRNASPHHLSPCQSCKNAQGLMENGHWSSSEHSQDCGYVSETHNGCCSTVSAASSLTSSPEGSEIACSDGFCNHEGDCIGNKLERNRISVKAQHKNCLAFNVKTHRGPTLTLQQMLEEFCSSDEEESFIPAEEVQEFKSRMPLVMEKRQELRLTLKKRFDQLCIKPPQPRVASLSN